MTIPMYIDLIPLTPTTGTRPTARDPLTRSATADELRSTTVTDPVIGDSVPCATLVERDRDCHAAVDRRYPPRTAYARTPVDREHASAARHSCRRRTEVLMRVCRIGAARF